MRNTCTTDIHRLVYRVVTQSRTAMIILHLTQTNKHKYADKRGMIRIVIVLLITSENFLK